MFKIVQFLYNLLCILFLCSYLFCYCTCFKLFEGNFFSPLNFFPFWGKQNSFAPKSEVRGRWILYTKIYNEWLSTKHRKICQNRIKIMYSKMWLQSKFGLIEQDAGRISLDNNIGVMRMSRTLEFLQQSAGQLFETQAPPGIMRDAIRAPLKCPKRDGRVWYRGAEGHSSI